MRLKSFFADTIEAAIGQARVEMGPDAMLVSSKQTSVAARHLGAYEVVCAGELDSLVRKALPDAAEIPIPSAGLRPGGPPAGPRPGHHKDRLLEEVADLRH